VPEGTHDDLAISLALAVKKLPYRRLAITGPLGVRKPLGSIWSQEGASQRAEPSVLGDDQPQADPEPAKLGVPMPILVRGGFGSAASKWNIS